MNFFTFLGATVFSAISGLVWAFCLGYPLLSGLTTGAGVGVILGLILVGFSKMATAPGNIQQGEASFVSGSIMTTLFMISTAIAIIVGLIRWIFF